MLLFRFWTVAPVFETLCTTMHAWSDLVLCLVGWSIPASLANKKGAHNYIIAYFMHAPTLIATFLFLSIQSEGWLSPTILILPGLSSDGDLTACLIFFLAAPGFWNTWLVALNGEVTIVSWFFLKTFKDTEMLRKSTKHIANPMKFGSHFITIRGPTSTWLRICDWC